MSDVVVVGAGLAGLAAARRLLALGHEVTVVEARERVGVRTEGLVLADGTPLELGGQWLAGSQPHVGWAASRGWRRSVPGTDQAAGASCGPVVPVSAGRPPRLALRGRGLARPCSASPAGPVHRDGP